jgi:hypothetical protein
MKPRLLLNAGLLFLLVFVIPVASAQPGDSALEASVLANDLVEALQAVQSDVESPEGQARALQAKRAASGLSEFGGMLDESRKLAGMLEDGLSLEQTRPVFLGVDAMRGNIRFLAEGVEVSEEIRPRLVEAGEILDRLKAIYQ